jgi:hypothetical protein
MTKLPTYDMNLINLVEQGLNAHVGKVNAVTTKYIIDKMKLRGYELSGPKIREIIHYLRVKKKMNICGDSSGYYIASSQKELEQQIKSLRLRRDEIQEVYVAMEGNYKASLKQQQLL